jgi:hypothetical protein
VDESVALAGAASGKGWQGLKPLPYNHHLHHHLHHHRIYIITIITASTRNITARAFEKQAQRGTDRKSQSFFVYGRQVADSILIDFTLTL